MKKLQVILTPVLILIFTAAIMVIAAAHPFAKFKGLLSVAFGAKDFGDVTVKSDTIDTDYNGKTYDSGKIKYPVFGENYAILKSKALGGEVPVYRGSSTELLEKGACQSTSSPVLGKDGNVVIDAHVDTFFSDLDKCKPGEKVVLYTTYGRFTYKVRENIKFLKSDTSYILPKNENILTLYTCKKELLGSSDVRTGVVCKLEKSEFYEKGED